MKSEPQSPGPNTEAVPPMPELPADGSNPAPVVYKQGVIYTPRKKRSFRALTNRGDNYSEKFKAWGGHIPTRDSWMTVVKEIEDSSQLCHSGDRC